MFESSRRNASLPLLLVAALTLQSIPVRTNVVFARTANLPVPPAGSSTISSTTAAAKTAAATEAVPSMILPAITATMSDAIVPTDDGDGKADPGGTEKIQYTVTISNSGTDATGVQFNDVLDTHTTLVGGSLNASPLAGDDAFTAIGNTLLVVGTVPGVSGPRKSIAGNVLTNDTDFLGDTFTISAFDAASANSGTVNMVTTGVDAGSFSYISAANFTGTDTFTYTIRDDGIDGVPGNSDDATGVGTVTITVANQVWYVDNSAAAGGNGRSTTPFDALADVTGGTGPDTTGDIIFLRTGSGPYTGGITLLVGQALWGENEALVVDTFTLQAAGSDPVITNAAGDGVTLPANGNNTLKGFTVGNTTSYDISSTVTTSVGTLNISNVILNGTGGLFRADSGGALTVTFDSAGTTSASANGFQLGNTSGSVTISGGAISGVTGTDVLISGGTVSLSCAASITHASGAAMVSVASHNTGTITFTGNLNASAGTGLQFDNADSTTSYNFNGTTSLSGGDAGIDILNGSAGTFSFSSNTSISNPSGVAFNLSASNPTVTYSGGITTNANRPVSISNGGAAACGTITFQTGNITANSGSNGILVNNCNSGTITFSGPAVSLTTTTNAGVTLTNNTGASIFFTSGNLDVLTTTGKAFTATGGGLIKVTGSGNTLATESDGSPVGGMILEVQNTTITTGGLNFVSLTGHGASSTTKGVYLLNAGTGGLAVTGTGSTAGSGGTITNYTQKGIHVDNTNNISLSNMNLAGNGTANLSAAGTCGDGSNGTNTNCAAGIDFQTIDTASLNNVHVSGGVQIGINGKNVTNLTLTNVEVNNNGNEALEDGIQIHNLFGTMTWSGLNLHDNTGRQLEVQNSSGTNNLTINSSTFMGASSPGSFPSATTGAQGVLYSARTAGNIKVTINNGTFARNYGAAFFSDIADTASADVTVDGGTMIDNGLHFQIGMGGTSATGSMTYALKNINTATIDPAHSISGPIGILKGANTAGNMTGTISGNTFGNPAVPFSGSPCISCVIIDITNGSSDSGLHKVSITNNTFSQSGHQAINITGGGNGTDFDGSQLQVNVTGNTIQNPADPISGTNPTGDQAIVVNIGTGAGDTTQACAHISGNTITGSWAAAAGGGHIRVRNRQPGTALRLPGFNGPFNDVTAAANFVSGQNGAVPATAQLQNGAVFSGGAPNACFLLLALGGITPYFDGSYMADTFPEASPITREMVAPGENNFSPGATSNVATSLNQQQLDLIVSAANQRWTATGLTAEQLNKLNRIKFEVTDLVGIYLGEADESRILVDRDAGGKGWFVDPTPLDDSEFDFITSATRRYTGRLGSPAGRVDLLTAIEHEIGHRLGLVDSYAAQDRDSIMYGYLSPGERRSLVIGQASGVAAGSLAGTHHLKLGTREVRTKERETTPSLSNVNLPPAPPCVNDSANVCVPIGDLRNSDSVTITFQVTVNNPPNLSLLNPPRVSNQGSVSYNESGTAVLTDDTSVVGSANPTETNVDLFDTMTSVITSGSPSNQGDAVTFTATVTESPAQTPDPTGTVQFIDGVTPLTCTEGGVNGIRALSGGTASCTTSAITPAGSPHTINANYSGDGNFDSSSGSVQQTVIACTTNPIVTNNADNGAGSLRQAILDACNGTTIDFAINPGSGPHTITLMTGELALTKNVTIQNASGESVTVSGNNLSRVFNINAGKTVSISFLTISGGAASNGGGVLNDGTLTISNSTLSSNTATSDGGAIHQTATANSLTLTNSTISGNYANGFAGGVDMLGGTATIMSSTITNNRGDNDTTGGGGAGGIRRQGGTLILHNTIVADNFIEAGVTDPRSDIDGVVDPASSYNLIGVDTGMTGIANADANQNKVGSGASPIDPVIGPLANNGGLTQTHRILGNSSPAMDAGNTVVTTDQRGQPRPKDNLSVGNAAGGDGDDIGAYEAPLPPGAPDLDAASDTGASSTDDYIADNTPTFTIGGVETGAFIELLAGATVVASGTAVGPTIQLTSSVLSDNTYSFTARQTVAGGLSPASTGLNVTIDTGAPGTPTIDLQAVSDSGSSGTDNITNATTRTFDIGNTENGATVELLRDGIPVVGSSTTGNGGTVQLSDSDALVSGTIYAYTARQTDLGGNQTSSSQLNVTFDSTAPNVTSIVRANANPTNAASVDFTVTFSENVTGVDTTDFTLTTTGTISGASVTTVTPINAMQYTVTVNTGTGDGTIRLDLTDNDSIADIAGNVLGGPGAQNFTTGEVYTIDKSAPTANITDVTPDPRNTSVSSITIVFNEAVTGFDINDLTLTLNGGANLLTGAQTLSSGDGGITWTLGNLSGITGANGTYLLTLTASGSGITDSASNALAGDATDSWVVDTTAPTVTINQALGQADPTSSSPINFTVVFSEPVTGFTNTDVTFSGAGATTATVTEVAPNDGTTYNVAISGMNTAGTVQATVNVNAAQDGAGNNSAASTSTDNSVQFVVILAVTIRDATVAEPGSGSANLIFTVALSAPAITPVTVDFITVDGTAKDGIGEANQDYTNSSGNVTFAVGQQVRTIHIPVLADSDNAEVDETMTVTLSNPTPNSTIADDTGIGTITVANTAGTMLISEFRQFGPGPGNDPLDDFVEIYNNTDAPITVPAGGYGLFRIPSTCSAADQPQLIGTIPAGTVIPGRGHFLFTGPIANYTLKDYGSTDGGKHNALLTADLGANENFGLFATADVSQISSLNRFDAVGFSPNNQNACDLLREGSTLNPVTTNLTLLGQHSFARKVCDWVQGLGCTAVPAGSPKDTNQNSVDFRFSDTNATNAGSGQNLGAPGPERAPDPGFPGVPGSVGGSPIKRDAPPGNSGMNVYLLDTSVAAAGVPNRLRSPGDPGGTFGTMTLRYRVLNNTGAPVTRLRYRIIDISTAPQPPGVADLRARTGGDVTVSNVNDPVTCNGGTPCMVLVRGTTLENSPPSLAQPSHPNGGGYNSTLSSGTVTMGTPLANGASIPISFVLGVQQTGTFRFYIIVEALP